MSDTGVTIIVSVVVSAWWSALSGETAREFVVRAIAVALVAVLFRTAIKWMERQP